jgi:lipopolysaccharide cholinephosphotransferase
MLPELQFIDREIALENMILLRDVLKGYGLVPFLHYGTLLGAMREHDFIPYDDDVDMGLYGKDKATFLKALPALEGQGFTIAYIRDDGYSKTSNAEDGSSNFRMYKLKRKDQELDVFLAFEKATVFGKRWDIDGRVTIPHKFLAALDSIEFHGHSFAAPHDPIGFLINLYGKTWNVPIRNTTSRIGWTTRLKKIKNPMRLFFFIRRYFSEKIRKRQLKKDFLREQSR